MRLGVEIGKTHGIGACHHHRRAGHKGFHLGLHRCAFSARFRETSGIHDDRAHTQRVAALEHGRDVGRAQRQHDEIKGSGHRLDIDPAFQAKDFVVFRVDRIDGALVAKLDQMRQRHAANAGSIVAGTNDGDGLRIEKGFEAVRWRARVQRRVGGQAGGGSGVHQGTHLFFWMAADRPRS